MENNNNGNFSPPVGSSTEEILAKVKASREQAKADAEKRYESEIAAKLEAQRLEREKQIKEEEEARQKAEAEFRMRIEREERARVEAEVKAQIDREQREKEEAEEKRFREMQVQLRIEAERRAREEAEQRMREEIATRERIEREVREKAETEYRAKVEAEYRAKIEAATRERERAVAAARAEAERRIIEAAEAKARAEVVEKSRREAEMRAKAEQEMRSRVSAEIREKAIDEERKRIERAEQNERELRQLAEEQRKIAIDEAARIKLELAHKAAIEQSYNDITPDTYDMLAAQPPIDSEPIIPPFFARDVIDSEPVAAVDIKEEFTQPAEPADTAPVQSPIDDETTQESSFLDDIRSNSDLDSILRRKKYRVDLDAKKVAQLSRENHEADLEDKYGFKEMQESFSPGFNISEEWDDSSYADNGITDNSTEDNTEDFILPKDQPKQAIFNDVAGITSEEEYPAEVEVAEPDETAEEGTDETPEIREAIPETVTAAENLSALENEINQQEQLDNEDPLASFFSEDNTKKTEVFAEDDIFAAEAGELKRSPLERLNLNPDLFNATEEDSEDILPKKQDELPLQIQKPTVSVKKSLKGIPLGGKSKRAFKNPLMSEISEYVHPNDAEDINQKLSSISRSALFKTIGTALIFLLSLVLQLSPVLSVPLPDFMNYRSNPTGYLLCNIVLLIAGIAVNFKELLFSFRRLIKGSFTFETPATVTSITGILYSLMLFSKTEQISMGASTLTALPLLVLTVISFYRLLSFYRTRDSFEFMTKGDGNHAVCRIENDALKSEIRSAIHHEPILLGDRKSAFAEDFFRNSFKDTESDELNSKLSALSVIAFLLVFAVSLICGAGFVNSFGNAFAVHALCSPGFFGFAVALQLFVSNKQHLSSGASIIGADTVKDFDSSNCMVVQSNDLFSSVAISGLKFLQDNVDEIIKFTAVATLLARSPLSDTFMGMIEDDTKQLPKVDSLLYKDGMGLICTAEGRRILIGKREFLSENNIAVPSKDAEDKVLKGRSMVSMVYVSLDGNLSAMFAVLYTPDNNIVDQICDANNCGVKIAIITSDPNITAKFLEKDLNLKPSSVCILPSKMIAEYMNEQEEDVTEAGIIHNGTAEGFTSGVAGVKMLFSNLKAIRLLQIGLCLFGLIVPSVFLILSKFNFISVIFTAVILVVANCIIPSVKRT